MGVRIRQLFAWRSVLGARWRRAGIITNVLNMVPKLCEANPKLPMCRPPTTPVKLCVMPWEKRIGSLGACKDVTSSL